MPQAWFTEAGIRSPLRLPPDFQIPHQKKFYNCNVTSKGHRAMPTLVKLLVNWLIEKLPALTENGALAISVSVCVSRSVMSNSWKCYGYPILPFFKWKILCLLYIDCWFVFYFGTIGSWKAISRAKGQGCVWYRNPGFCSVYIDRNEFRSYFSWEGSLHR